MKREWKPVIVGKKGAKSMISISRSGSIRFNAQFVRECGIKDTSFVKVYQTQEGSNILVGFEFLQKKEENTLKLGYMERSKSCSCSGGSLLRELDIDPTKIDKRRFTPSIEEYAGKRLFVITMQKKSGGQLKLK